MTPEEFASANPVVLAWIHQTIADHKHLTKTVASRGFKRLPRYFSGDLLQTTKVATVDRIPMPPLSAIGLQRFGEFERSDYDGITYLDTIFVKRARANEEELHFHELIPVLQWHLLGPERFLALYADGLERFGYLNSPLERMAYLAQQKFGQSKRVFDAQALVLYELGQLSAL
jgi:hypothetical protein